MADSAAGSGKKATEPGPGPGLAAAAVQPADAGKLQQRPASERMTAAAASPEEGEVEEGELPTDASLAALNGVHGEDDNAGEEEGEDSQQHGNEQNGKKEKVMRTYPAQDLLWPLENPAKVLEQYIQLRPETPSSSTKPVKEYLDGYWNPSSELSVVTPKASGLNQEARQHREWLKILLNRIRFALEHYLKGEICPGRFYRKTSQVVILWRALSQSGGRYVCWLEPHPIKPDKGAIKSLSNAAEFDEDESVVLAGHYDRVALRAALLDEAPRGHHSALGVGLKRMAKHFPWEFFQLLAAKTSVDPEAFVIIRETLEGKRKVQPVAIQQNPEYTLLPRPAQSIHPMMMPMLANPMMMQPPEAFMAAYGQPPMQLGNNVLPPLPPQGSPAGASFPPPPPPPLPPHPPINSIPSAPNLPAFSSVAPPPTMPAENKSTPSHKWPTEIWDKAKEKVLRYKLLRTPAISLTTQGFHPDMIMDLCRELGAQYAPESPNAPPSQPEPQTPTLVSYPLDLKARLTMPPQETRISPEASTPSAKQSPAPLDSEALRRAALASLKRKAAQISGNDERAKFNQPNRNGASPSPSTPTEDTSASMEMPSFEDINNMVSVIELRQRLKARMDSRQQVTPSVLSAAPAPIGESSSASSAAPTPPPGGPLPPRRQRMSYADDLGSKAISAPTGEVDMNTPLPTIDIAATSASNGAQENDGAARARKRMRPSAADMYADDESRTIQPDMENAVLPSAPSFSSYLSARNGSSMILDFSDSEDEEEEQEEEDEDAPMEDAEELIRHPTLGWRSFRKQTQRYYYAELAGQELELPTNISPSTDSIHASAHLARNSNGRGFYRARSPLLGVGPRDRANSSGAGHGTDNSLKQLEEKERAIREMQLKIQQMEQARKLTLAKKSSTNALSSGPLSAGPTIQTISTTSDHLAALGQQNGSDKAAERTLLQQQLAQKEQEMKLLLQRSQLSRLAKAQATPAPGVQSDPGGGSGTPTETNLHGSPGRTGVADVSSNENSFENSQGPTSKSAEPPKKSKSKKSTKAKKKRLCATEVSEGKCDDPNCTMAHFADFD